MKFNALDIYAIRQSFIEHTGAYDDDDIQSIISQCEELLTTLKRVKEGRKE